MVTRSRERGGGMWVQEYKVAVMWDEEVQRSKTQHEKKIKNKTQHVGDS